MTSYFRVQFTKLNTEISVQLSARINSGPVELLVPAKETATNGLHLYAVSKDFERVAYTIFVHQAATNGLHLYASLKNAERYYLLAMKREAATAFKYKGMV
jgi:hypothetical protein